MQSVHCKNLIKKYKWQSMASTHLHDSWSKAVFVARARERVLSLQERQAMSVCCNAFTNKLRFTQSSSFCCTGL